MHPFTSGAEPGWRGELSQIQGCIFDSDTKASEHYMHSLELLSAATMR